MHSRDLRMIDGRIEYGGGGLTLNHSPKRMDSLHPLPNTPEVSWWTQDPEHFYETAAQEALRMARSKVAHSIKLEGEAKTSGGA